ALRSGASDVYVEKLALGKNGAITVIWVNDYGTGVASLHGNAVQVDGSGNIWVGITSSASTDWGGATLPAGGIVLKLTSSGANVTNWPKQIGNASGAAVYGLALDASGNPIALGAVGGPTDLGNGVNTTSEGAFAAKYSSASGAHIWS